MKKFKIVLSIVFIISISILVVRSVIAQESSTGLVAAPPYISKNVGQGVMIEEDIRVTNHRDTDEDFYIVSREIAIDENGEYYIPEAYDQDMRSSFEKKGWLEFEPKDFFLKKGEGKIVNVKIQIPEGLPTKGYYLELVVTTQPPDSIEEGVGVAPEIAIPILINYIGIGEEIRSLEIVAFESDKVLYEYLPVKFNTHLANKGNVHLIPVGQIFISKRKDFVDNAGSLEFNSGNHRVLTDAGRKFEDVWSDAFIFRDIEGKLSFDWSKLNKLRFGKYYAQLNVAWEENEGVEFIQAVTSFWVIPWKLLMIPVAILTTIIFWKICKKRREKGIKKYQ